MMKKLLHFPLIRAFIGILWLLVVYVLGQLAFVPVVTAVPLLGVLVTLVAGAVGLAVYYAFARWYEQRREMPELALAPAPWELLQGLAWGAGLFTVVFLIMLVFGYMRLEGVNGWAGVPAILGVAIISGVMEELIIRAVFYRIMQEWLGTWVALALSAVLFGAAHLSNPNASWVAGAAIALEAGILLGLAYQATGRVWLPIGLHLAWNFTQGGIFGVPISGFDLGGLLRSSPNGPEWLSGGSFGAEASIFSVMVCLTAAGYFLWRVVREGKVAPAFWQRPAPAVNTNAAPAP